MSVMPRPTTATGVRVLTGGPSSSSVAEAAKATRRRSRYGRDRRPGQAEDVGGLRARRNRPPHRRAHVRGLLHELRVRRGAVASVELEPEVQVPAGLEGGPAHVGATEV